jgi:hypothetical protein
MIRGFGRNRPRPEEAAPAPSPPGGPAKVRLSQGGEGRLSRGSCRGSPRMILPGPFAPDDLTGGYGVR